MTRGETGTNRGAGGDLLVTHIGQLLTMRGPRTPRTGSAMRDVGLERASAVLIRDGRIEAVGPEAAVGAEAGDAEVLDAHGRLVLPGFVDPHTHAAFAGSRAEELGAKLAGKSYAQIAAEGGGIQRTVRDTRQATAAELVAATVDRVGRMVASGSTTVEIKSGYGLTPQSEVALLEAIAAVEEHLPVTVVPTFLGAHAVPEEYAGNAEGYVEELVTATLPTVVGRKLARFCDVFVDEGYFSPSQGERLLIAGQSHDLPSKVHADELTSSGGAELAAQVGAISAEHLVHASARGLRALRAAGTVAVLLPGTAFSTPGLPYTEARNLVDLGLPVALGTDLSPNSWIESQAFVISLACYRLRLAPEEALCAATHNAACAVGMQDEVGTLEPGKRGDLLVLEAQDYREIPYRIAANLVRHVVKDGTVVVTRPSAHFAGGATLAPSSRE